MYNSYFLLITNRSKIIKYQLRLHQWMRQKDKKKAETTQEKTIQYGDSKSSVARLGAILIQITTAIFQNFQNR